MKKFLLFALLIMWMTNPSNAQCTNPYYQFTEGTVIETTSYNAKDKLDSKMVMEVIEWEETGAGYLATMGYKMYDKKDKLITEGEYEMECDNGMIKIDMDAFVPKESMQAYEDMEMEISSDQLMIPAELEEGMYLEDAFMDMKVTGSPMPMNFTFRMTDREVMGRESVTTPAGTFDCWKLDQTMKSKMMVASTEFRTVQYIAEEYGAVKTETYKKNGKLMSYSLLTRYEK